MVHESPEDETESLGHVSLDQLFDFISQLVKVTLGTSDADSRDIFATANEQHLSRFITEASHGVLYIQQEQANAETTQQHRISIGFNLAPSKDLVSTLAIIKRLPVLRRDKPLREQVQILNLPGQGALQNDTSAFESLHNLIRLAVSPYFDAYTGVQDHEDGVEHKADGLQQGIPVTKKKIAELELSLLHLQQNVDVPPVSLIPHPAIQQAVRNAASAHRKPTINDLPDSVSLENLSFINSVQATTVAWRQQIKELTDKDRDPHSGTASQEINFWLNVDHALGDIEAQLKGDSTVLTFEVLAAGKRMGVNNAMLIQDTGLKESREKVRSYNMLMRDFPINDLLSAPTLEKVATAVDLIFDHLNRRLRTVPYPVARAIPLTEAITADIETQVYSRLRVARLMHLSHPAFQETLRSAGKVFAAYDNRIKDFITTSRDVLRKRNERFLVIKVNAAHTKLQERLTYLRRFREGHEQLSKTIASILGTNSPPSSRENFMPDLGQERSALEQISQAYDGLKKVDVLDVSTKGTDIWVAAERDYDDHISGVEATIITILRNRLDTASSANEMFRIFSTFNALFVRPKIRGAIQEYQTQLVDEVKQDVQKLQEKFKTRYYSSDVFLLNTLRDIPSLSGHIVWIRQINQRLDEYMQQVESVLGQDWHMYAEGQKLYMESTSFRKKLDIKSLYEQWLQQAKQQDNIMKGSVLSVVRNRAAGNVLEIVVNFEERAISLFKEVRNLFHLGFNVPHQISTAAKSAKQIYPFAMSIIESNDAISRLHRRIQSLGPNRALLAGFSNDVQAQILSVASLQWQVFREESGRSQKSAQIVSDWANAVSIFQDKVEILFHVSKEIEESMRTIATCQYDTHLFARALNQLQGIVDRLSLEGYTNLSSWCSQLNERVQDALTERCRRALTLWIQHFSRDSIEDTAEDARYNLDFPVLKLELTFRDRNIDLIPSVDYVPVISTQHLSTWLKIGTHLPQLNTNHHARHAEDMDYDFQRATFAAVADKVAIQVQEAHKAIQHNAAEIADYTGKWMQFQSLWELQHEQAWNMLGEDLGAWLRILEEIRKARTTFDNSDSYKTFNHVTVYFDQIQNRVNSKYDTWHKEILKKFADVLSAQMRAFYDSIYKLRSDLESQNLDSTTTASAVAFITTAQQCKRMLPIWTANMRDFCLGQGLLFRQRHHFPDDWLSAERLDGEWSALLEIYERKNNLIEEQIDALRARIDSEDSHIRSKISSTCSVWRDERPISADQDREDAKRIIERFGEKLQKLKNQADLVERAKNALALNFEPLEELTSVLEEIQDFKSVWAVVSNIWEALTELRETSWSAVIPRKLRVSLEELYTTTKDVPSRIRQYAAFEHVQLEIKTFLKLISVLTELRSEAMRERHWVSIFKVLQPKKRVHLNSLTLGDIWDLNLHVNDKIIRQVLTEAAGQLAMEEFLREIRDVWSEYKLDLMNYRNKCKLIKGWDDLFAQTSEHLNALSAMRHSTHFKVFEEEARAWEDKLNRVHVLFDTWIDVQRQWVYLEGIFADNLDIKHLLPLETSRFASISTDFLGLMRRTSKSGLVLDIINIPQVQKTVERLADMLVKIQKALGDYLERERAQFPRFYFIGDEDLLEIIGNAKEIGRVEKHLKKMFAGISSLYLKETEDAIVGFGSKEGERVMLTEELSLTKYTQAKDWLWALESGMQTTLSLLLSRGIQSFQTFVSDRAQSPSMLREWLEAYPMQILVLSAQCVWTSTVESCLAPTSSFGLVDFAPRIEDVLEALSAVVLLDLTNVMRAKCVGMITELVHERDVVSRLILANVLGKDDFHWQYYMRFYHQPERECRDKLWVCTADTSLPYGFEYLGISEKIVQTPLTDRCYLTLTQALHQKLGGSPFGPAGTGKTETVKALGTQLGRFVLVFCCDDAFDYQAMGRIFLGLCRVGAWGCFDEFNRLEERMLSAVSQQIQTIQTGLRASGSSNTAEIELVGRRLTLHENTGIFITMNPGYAGRSNLPNNLKKLFLSFSMTKPDKELIAQITFYGQGFHNGKQLAEMVVPFFARCQQDMSKQPHYDFGLRALKSVLLNCGYIRRGQLRIGDTEHDFPSNEKAIVLRGLHETIIPKLVGDDCRIFLKIADETFPGILYTPDTCHALRGAIDRLAPSCGLLMSEHSVLKCVQLSQLLEVHHGIMLVGPAGSGKSTTWSLLSDALRIMDGKEAMLHVIDAKVMSKELLFGKLDSTTREWTDGLFTSILRKIVDNLRGEATKRHWIVFDGDVDPEWVENLNSILDDNKLLTLPNGERLPLPSNTKILFEVEDLRNATPATITRCGMVYFDHDLITVAQTIERYLWQLRQANAIVLDEDMTQRMPEDTDTQQILSDVLKPYFESGGLVMRALERASNLPHIMAFSTDRALQSLFSLCLSIGRDIIQYNSQHTDFQITRGRLETFIFGKLLLYIIWSFAGDSPMNHRIAFAQDLYRMSDTNVSILQNGLSLFDLDMSLPNVEWFSWIDKVPNVELDPSSIDSTELVVPTVDTLRHEAIIFAWLAEHRPVILCGPPGSGKTMTLFNALKKRANIEVAAVNFSSATTPGLVLRALEQFCEYKQTMNSTVLAPAQPGRWVVLFCDEINLPAPDTYGTQRVVSFLRQLIERKGFWRNSTQKWISIERIQFVGACNPPTDPGRSPLSQRFLRHVPVIMVDYPSKIALQQIYGTYNKAILKYVPNLRGYTEAITSSMIDVYEKSSLHFTTESQSHYVYSPRELSRWSRGICAALRTSDFLTIEGLVRVWAYEAKRLFGDRLVNCADRAWSNETIRDVGRRHFPSIDESVAMQEPILYSDWITEHYTSVDHNQMREYIQARLRTFSEEEIDTSIIPFDEVIDQVLQIDRVFKQPQGHLILIGISGMGKSTLCRFVSWINGMKTFRIKIHRKYSAQDFDDDLRDLLRACGTKNEKTCFLLDESSVLDSGFLERMNTLLANAQIPGLFAGEEFSALLTACREGAQRDGLLLDTEEELLQWFTKQIIRNLHVVFTMNPPGDLTSSTVTSPALFNRCVLNWLGNWSTKAFLQVGTEFLSKMDLARQGYKIPSTYTLYSWENTETNSYRQVIIDLLVKIHQDVQDVHTSHKDSGHGQLYLTPCHFLDMLKHCVELYSRKRTELEDQQRHLNSGLSRLQSTVSEIDILKNGLGAKREQLEIKSAQANQKLQNMLEDQREAEQKKVASLEIQESITIQEKAVSERRAIVVQDLAQAEPAVLEAQKSVSNIKKQQLTEVRSMANPPEAVKLTMESVCTLLGHHVEGWKSVQSVIRREDFISSIVNFDSESQMTSALRATMQKEYMSKPMFQYEAVNRASKACGPLVQWVVAQVMYSQILDQVGPLRAEVETLEKQAILARKQANAMADMISELEASIELYKSEYADLISEVQSIKREMQQVESKVLRSTMLLESLSSEKDRWGQSSQTFEHQLRTLVGNTILSAAFLAYSGAFGQSSRQVLHARWRAHLCSAEIEYDVLPQNSTYLASADDRARWQLHGLPADDVTVENAIILRDHIRYPLIIDPTGRAIKYLEKEHAKRKVTITSFLDDSFIKHVEAALRFGNTVVINDAEYLDPVLNHVLDREHKKTGGRTLVEFGNHDIDVSPLFRLFLITRDPLVSFTPNVSSKVTFVNFTVTKASLVTQSLQMTLRSVRPDIERKYRAVLMNQDELQSKLRRLENDLLISLNESQGSILEDNAVVDTLERLKKEAAVVAHEIAQTQVLMSDMGQITDIFKPIGSACSLIFSVLERLGDINHLYRFSLRTFEEILINVLKDVHNDDGASKDTSAQVEIILQKLNLATFQRISQSMLHQDHIVLAVLLMNPMTKLTTDFEVWETILNKEVHGTDVSEWDSEHLLRYLDEVKSDVKLAPIAATILESSVLDVQSICTENSETQNFEFDSATIPFEQKLHKVLLMKLLRTDRVIPSLEALAADVLQSGSSYNIRAVAKGGALSSKVPIMLCATPGYDAAFQVDALVVEQNVICHSIAMGSLEGEALAERAITSASQVGSWVLLKNVHLAPTWLAHLEKRIHTLTPHDNFRLFLTLEMTSDVPGNLITMSHVLMFEAPPGMKANMLEAFKLLPDQNSTLLPAEKSRLYFMLVWFHSVVQERLRYAGIGWSKAYDFNDADLQSTRRAIDSWMLRTSAGRANLAPENIPWQAIKCLITEALYGGRIDTVEDEECLRSLVERYFSPHVFDTDHLLVNDTDQQVIIPDTSSLSQFVAWTQKLPDHQSPTWLGLEHHAERMMLTKEGERVLLAIGDISRKLEKEFTV